MRLSSRKVDVQRASAEVFRRQCESRPSVCSLKNAQNLQGASMVKALYSTPSTRTNISGSITSKRTLGIYYLSDFRQRCLVFFRGRFLVACARICAVLFAGTSRCDVGCWYARVVKHFITSKAEIKSIYCAAERTPKMIPKRARNEVSTRETPRRILRFFFECDSRHG